MLCSRCNKNVAVIFVTRIENGKSVNEGLCMPCARELGINTLQQMAGGMDFGDMENIEEQLMELSDADLAPDGEMPPAPSAISSLLSNIFGAPGERKSADNETPREKKAQKKESAKKRKLLDTYGVNLTEKARRGEVDAVIGREAEIARHFKPPHKKQSRPAWRTRRRQNRRGGGLCRKNSNGKRTGKAYR